MGFRGNVKSGGGFWNNVDGKIVGYSFTQTPPGGSGKSEWVYFVPSIHVDGAEKATTQHLFMGSADRYSISKDGQTIEDANGGNVTIGAKTPAGRFLLTALDNGLDEGELPDLEAGEPLNLAGIVGYRVRLAQEVDAEGTRKQGKRKYKDAQGNEREADRTNTVIAAVYGKEGGAKSGKPALAKGAKTAANTNTIRDKADKVLLALIEKAGGVFNLAKLSVGVIRELQNDSDKDAVKTLAKSAAYIADAVERGVIEHDSDEGTVQAA